MSHDRKRSKIPKTAKKRLRLRVDTFTGSGCMCGGNNYKKDPIPPQPSEPTNNLNHVGKYDILLCGYIRNIDDMDIEKIPIDLIDFCTKWLSDGITYKQALDTLLNKERCFGLYDFELKEWRPVVHILHSNDKQEIFVRFIDSAKHDGSCPARTHSIIKDFPVNYILMDSTRFKAPQEVLKNIQ